MWLKPYLSSITWHYMSLKAKESVWHSDSHTKFQEKKKLSKSLLYHILSGIYDSCSSRANNEMTEPRIVLS